MRSHLLLSFLFTAWALEVQKAVDTLQVYSPPEQEQKPGVPAQWRKVALVYAGHHYRIGGPPFPPRWHKSRNNPKLFHGPRHTADWRVTRGNHHDNLIGPLAKRGIAVDVYFHTWPSHMPIEAELVEYLKPVKYTIAFGPSLQAAGVDSRVEALKLIIDPESYDAIIMTRFDLTFAKPLDMLPLQPHKVNVPFREISELSFRTNCRVSDLMYIFPPKYLGLFTNRSWALGHGLIRANPLADRSKIDEYGCPQWQEHINLMTSEYGLSGEVNWLGFMSRDVMTIEDGPYYGTSMSSHGIAGMDSSVPIAKPSSVS